MPACSASPSQESTSGPGEQVVAADILELHAGSPGTGGAIGVSAQGKGSITVGNVLLADASSDAAQYVAAPVVLDATGGLVSILADDGNHRRAALGGPRRAVGGFGAAIGGNAGPGTIAAQVDNGGTISSGTVAFGCQRHRRRVERGGRRRQRRRGEPQRGQRQLQFRPRRAVRVGHGRKRQRATPATASAAPVDVAIASGLQDWDSLTINAHAIAGGHPAPGVGLSGSAAANPDA
jgi:hypothetical protein